MPKDRPPRRATRSILEELKQTQKLVRAIPSGDDLEETVRAIKSLCMQWKTIQDVQVRFVEPFANGFHRSNPGTSTSSLPGWLSNGLSSAEYDADLLRQTASSGRSLYVVRDEDKSSSTQTGPAAAYYMPLQTQCHEAVFAVLIAGTYDAFGISEDTRTLLELLAPQLALVMENGFLCRESGHLVDDHPAIPAGKRYHRPPVHSGLQTSHLAHEIKNALTAVSTFMQLLPTKWDDRHFRSSFYPVAREEARQANRLVSILLDRGRHHAGRLVAVDMQELVRHLVRLKTPLAEQRSLRFRTHLALRSPIIRIHPQKIQEAVANLINNAMDATPKGGQIDIRLSEERLSGGQPAIRVEIQDSGPGVAKNIRDRIFEPYVSTKARLPAAAGSAGLGLSIARRNVRAHGGTIEVENATASGALFRIILPVERRRA